MVKIRLQGKPYALKRHRMTRKGHTYDPPDNIKWKKMAQFQFNAQRVTPMHGPLLVIITAVFLLPKYRHRKREPVLDRTAHWGRPDIDNIVKAIFDAGNGFLWDDDAQIAAVFAQKWYGSQIDDPYTEIEISSVDDSIERPDLENEKPL